MKILFITPYDNNYRYKSAFMKSLSYMPLTMPYLAALTPEKYNAEFKAVDEGVQKVNYEKLGAFDIVAITAVTSSVKRGYELAAYFKEKGSYVVMGGHHVTLMPDEAAEHADTVMTGPADRIWSEFINDFAEGKAKARYDGVHSDIGSVNVIPRRDIMKKSKYLGVPSVIASFGCTNRCEFCEINSFLKGRHAARKIDNIAEEIRLLKSKYILFLDSSPTCNCDFAKAFYKALIPLKIKWVGQCTTDVCDNDELFELMVRSGCVGVLMGFETFDGENLKDANKKNKVEKYKATIDKLHENGIAVLGTFIVGFDRDTKESIMKMPDYIEEIGVDIPRFAILTPYPGKPIYRRFLDSGRILTTDWNDYDCIHATYTPKNLTPDELEELFLYVSRECYTVKRIRKRLQRKGNNKLIRLILNISFRIYNQRVERNLRAERSQKQ